MIHLNNKTEYLSDEVVNPLKVVVIGGGRVGLPLATVLAKFHDVTICDSNKSVLSSIEKKSPLFFEPNLAESLKTCSLSTCTPEEIPQANFYIITIGTPMLLHEEFDVQPIFDVIDSIGLANLEWANIILRSTVPPGTCDVVMSYLEENYSFKNLVISAPERLAEGKAIAELFEFPQVIGIPKDFMITPVFNDLDDLFCYAPEIYYCSPVEAELSKIFSNVWRYGKFALVNSFSMIANDYGADYREIHKAMTLGYNRNKDLPSPGFTAGPCLRKDWAMIPYSQSHGLFASLHEVNEAYADYTAELVEEVAESSSTNILVYGISMKPGSDDIRDSLTFRLNNKLKMLGFTNVHFADGAFPYNQMYDNIYLESLDEALVDAEVVVIATPAEWMKQSKVFKDKIVIDPWMVL